MDVRPGDFPIVEIGSTPLLKSARPNEVVYFHTGHRLPRSSESHGHITLSLATFRLFREHLAHPGVRLIVCQPHRHSPWGSEGIARAVGRRDLLAGNVPLFRALGPYLARAKARLAVVDLDDVPLIKTHNLGLLDRCHLYFLRELPIDHWMAFCGTAGADVPSARIRRSERWRGRVAKLRPVPLGLPLGAEEQLDEAPVAKTTDIFFAGWTAGSTLRERGLAELRALEAEGVDVDIPTARLPLAEFFRRSAAAFLVWSPPGFGWDCFRHYEAAANASVPLMTHAHIERHAPFPEGEAALYYAPEPGGLAAAIRAALGDRDRLHAMGAAARRHWRSHLTRAAIAEHIIGSAMA